VRREHILSAMLVSTVGRGNREERVEEESERWIARVRDVGGACLLFSIRGELSEGKVRGGTDR
jgi:hypothetical protein